jgi:hypothetical protein
MFANGVVTNGAGNIAEAQGLFHRIQNGILVFNWSITPSPIPRPSSTKKNGGKKN